MSGTGLIKNNGRNFFGNLKGFTIFNQYAQLSATANTNRHGGWCCETQRTGARDNRTETKAVRAKRSGSGGTGNTKSHTMNAVAAMASTTGIKYVTAVSAIRCTGGFEPCASSTSWMIWASTVSLPTFVDFYRKHAVGINRPANHPASFGFEGGDRLTGDHGFIDITLTRHNFTVDRDLTAGFYDDNIPDNYIIDRNFLFLTITDNCGSFCPEPGKFPDRSEVLPFARASR